MDNENWSYQSAPRMGAAYQASGMVDGVIVPVLKSMFFGFTSGILAGLLCWALALNLSPWLAWAIVWFGVTALSFWRYSERAQWMIERITGADLNGDGFVGIPQPELPAPHLRVDLIENGGKIGEAGAFIDLPYPERLPEFAQSVLRSQTFAQSLFVGTGRLFTRGEYDTLIDALITAGLARWKNTDHHNQGIDLTYAGKSVLKKIAELQQ